MTGGQVGGCVAPAVSRPRVSASPQQQAGGGQVAVAAGLSGKVSHGVGCKQVLRLSSRLNESSR
jgi:hypothetical protein